MTTRRTLRSAGTIGALSALVVGAAGASALAAGVLHPGTQVRPEPTVHGAGLARYAAPVRTGIAQPDTPTGFSATLPNGRRVTPAGRSVTVGENPLGSALTPDGRFLVVTDSDERNPGARSTTGTSQDQTNGAGQVPGGYTLAVVRTADLGVSATATVPANPAAHGTLTIPGKTQSDKTNGLFVGVTTVTKADGTTHVYAAGGPSDLVYDYPLSADGTFGTPALLQVPVPQDPSRPNYGMAAPAGMTLGPDGRTLYVVLNNGDAVAQLDTSTNTFAASTTPVGHFPYTAAVSPAGDKLFVSNWGVAGRRFLDGSGAASGTVVTHATSTHLGSTTENRFENPDTDEGSSSLSVLPLAGGTLPTVPLGIPIDGLRIVGGTHPSALATVRRGSQSVLYVADANEDAIAVVDADRGRLLGKLDLPTPIDVRTGTPGKGKGRRSAAPFGLTPDALVASPDGSRLYVAEAGLNDVAVLDTSTPSSPHLIGRIPTGWYPTGLSLSADGRSLFVTNAKGAGSPYRYQGTYAAPGSYPNPDVNLLFGTVQRVDLATTDLAAGAAQVVRNTYRTVTPDTKKIAALQDGIQHIVYILKENKTYDTYFGDDAVLNARGADGSPAHAQYGPYVPNAKRLAEQYVIGDNAYADAEESNAGHSFALAGTSTDYQQKTLLSRFNRPFINTKNEDPEDYPLRGYLFNNLARNGRSYRDYGDMIRVSGYDDGQATDPCEDDPFPGCDPTSYPYLADTRTVTAGLGGRFSEDVPALKVLGGHIDETYPGWNLRISDQRRAQEFIKDFDGLAKQGKAPQLTFLWLPEDHTGGCGSAPAAVATCTPTNQVADGDAALGQVMQYLTSSPLWPHTAVFLTEDDAQGSPDHVSAHRSYTAVFSPYAKNGAVVHSLSSTVSVPKTIEEILDLPPMNVGDLVGNDLLDYFTDVPAARPGHTAVAPHVGAAPAEALRISALTARLDTSTYDADSTRLGRLDTLFTDSLRLSSRRTALSPAAYRAQQDALYRRAQAVVRG